MMKMGWFIRTKYCQIADKIYMQYNSNNTPNDCECGLHGPSKRFKFLIELK